MVSDCLFIFYLDSDILSQRDVDKRLGCAGQGAQELKTHPFFTGVDWTQVYQQKYPPPLIPPRGEVNAADAFDIGSFDEEDTKGLKLTDADQELYKNFPLVISERWQNEVSSDQLDWSGRVFTRTVCSRSQRRCLTPSITSTTRRSRKEQNRRKQSLETTRKILTASCTVILRNW